MIISHPKPERAIYMNEIYNSSAMALVLAKSHMCPEEGHAHRNRYSSISTM